VVPHRLPQLPGCVTSVSFFAGPPRFASVRPFTLRRCGYLFISLTVYIVAQRSHGHNTTNGVFATAKFGGFRGAMIVLGLVGYGRGRKHAQRRYVSATRWIWRAAIHPHACGVNGGHGQPLLCHSTASVKMHSARCARCSSFRCIRPSHQAASSASAWRRCPAARRSRSPLCRPLATRA